MKQKLGVQYKVLKRFEDKETKVFYSEDGFYAHPDQERIDFLIEKGYLEKRPDDSAAAEFPRHTGGGWYQLSNGEKVKGKEEALAAEKDFQKSGE